MKDRLGALRLLTALLFLTGCSNGQSDNDQKENNKGMIPEFEIEFPKTEFEVKKYEDINSVSIEDLLITNWILKGETGEGPFLYYVTHHKVPAVLKTEMAQDPDALTEFFKAGMISSASKKGGENFRFTGYNYDQYPGLEGICDVFKKNGVIKSRMIKADNDIFVLGAGGRKVSIAVVDKFLDSFRLKK